MWRSAICGLACLTMVVVSAVTFWVGKTAQKAIADAGIAIQHIDQTVGKVGSAADNLGGVIADERTAETDQLRASHKAVLDAQALILSLKDSLVGSKRGPGLIPVAVGAIAQLSTDQHVTFQKIDETMDFGAKGLQSLNSRIADPRIDTILSELSVSSLHFDSVTANMADATAHGNAILGHGEHVAAYYDSRLTTPQGFVKTLGLGLWHLVIPASNIAIAIK